jgi:uncharacterized protein (TIGR03435 family)
MIRQSRVCKVLARALRTAAAGLLPVVSGGLSLLPSGALAQTAPEAPAFEVVSIKPSKAGAGGPRMSPSPGGLAAANVTVKMLIRAAYRVEESSMSGGPGWLDSAQYDVTAKTEQRATEEQLRLMLQKLLADRFQLRVHRETKPGSAYALVPSNKNAPGLRPANAAECAADTRPANPCGRFRKSAQGQITGEKVSMAELAHFLSAFTGLPVSDQTGLSGVFDISMRASSDDRVNGAGSKEPPGSDPDQSAPSIFTALREQLGLKLEPAKGAAEWLVIESAKKPSDN